MRSNQSTLILATLIFIAGVSMSGLFGAGKAPTPALFSDQFTFEQAAERGVKEGKPVFAVFTASWCGPCQSYKRGALADPAVEKLVRASFIPVLVDVDQQRDVASKFQVSSIPQTAVIRGDQRIRGAIGQLDKDELSKFVRESAEAAGTPAR